MSYLCSERWQPGRGSCKERNTSELQVVPSSSQICPVLHSEAVGWQEGISTNSSVLYTQVSTEPFTEHRERYHHTTSLLFAYGFGVCSWITLVSKLFFASLRNCEFLVLQWVTVIGNPVLGKADTSGEGYKVPCSFCLVNQKEKVVKFGNRSFLLIGICMFPESLIWPL